MVSIAYFGLLPSSTVGAQTADADTSDRRPSQSFALEPMPGYFSSSDNSHRRLFELRDTFLKEISDTPVILLLVTSPFGCDQVIVIQERKANKQDEAESYEVIWLKGEGLKSPFDTDENFEAARKSVLISKELAESLRTLWFTALGTVTYSPLKSTKQYDGSSYIFSAYKEDFGYRAGYAFSPEKNSLPYKLKGVTSDLVELVKIGENNSKQIADKEKQLMLIVKDIQTSIEKREPAGAGQPATKPAGKPPVKGQPSTPTSKGGPR
jgi:hypothetical protein